MLKDDAYYMGLALREAEDALSEGEVPIGALVVTEAGGIASKAHNNREAWHDATAHAEIVAIRAACAKLGRWRLTGCTLYVTLEPCPMCAGALVMSRMRRLVYGLPDSKAGAAESLFNIVNNSTLNHRLQVTAGVREDDCGALLKKFFAGRRPK